MLLSAFLFENSKSTKSLHRRAHKNVLSDDEMMYSSAVLKVWSTKSENEKTVHFS